MSARPSDEAPASGLRVGCGGWTTSASFRREQALVAARLSKLGVAAHDLDDVAQEVLVDLCRAHLTVPTGRTWAQARAALRFAILRCKAQQYQRARFAQREDLTPTGGDPRPSSAELVPSVEEDAISRERAARLHQALDELRAQEPSFAAVVVAFELHGDSMGEIAAASGVRENTAWNRLRLGRNALRAALQRGETKRENEERLALQRGKTA